MKKILELSQEAEQVLLQVIDGALAHLKFSGGGHALVSKLLSFVKEVEDKKEEPKEE